MNHLGPIIAEKDGLRVRACTTCGYAHLDPLPDPADLAGYYAGEFWQREKAGWRERYEAQRDWLDMRHHDWLELLMAHTTGEGGRTLLDVGCGWGHFLQTAQARAWRVWGLDPSLEAVDYCRAQGLARIECATWEASGYGVRWDVVSALWLLEHLPDPLAFLRWCRARLVAGGALLLAVPNEFNQFQHWANEDGKCLRDFFVHPTHCNYFNPATLGNLLGRAGFRVVEWLATWPIEFELVQGTDYTRDEALGAQVHAHIRAQELSMDRRGRLARGRMLARQALGRDLILVAKVEG